MNQSKVIYCFDCDDYDINPADADFLKEAKRYCADKGYKFAWFCKDVEQAYLGRKVDAGQKEKEAISFKSKRKISEVDTKRLSVNHYRNNTSNIMRIMDEYLERKTR